MKFKSHSQRKAVMARYRNWNKQHSNFITPNVIKAKVSKDGKQIIELSTGRGFDNNNVYGVSYLGIKPNKFISGEDKRSKLYIVKEKAIKSYEEEKWDSSHPIKEKQ